MAAKSGGSKNAPGLLSKLKGALSSKKPEPSTPKAPAKPAPKPAAKAAPAKPAAKAAAKPPAKPAAPAKAAPAAKSPAPSSSMKSASPDKTSKSAAAAPAKPAAPAKKAAAAPAPAPAPKKPASRKPIVRMSFDGLPTEDQLRAMSDDDYMNDSQLEFFRHRLLQMRAEVLEREVDVKERLHQREVFADPADRATAEEEHWLDLRLRERESLLLRKIDDALRRLENREFGYCEKTGDPIGIPRLLARPTATVCVDVKGQDERVEAQFRDR
ncbi:RNA polymerase-binding protein DksA [Solimonas sp. K1W22B-7]|uniref:RNA polymerase-binding protein DksA n=1 Tax=Solimonas sp. K1W22B-7 TaxID=2303331 RepID=UPI001F0901AE|nr:RNA polymerase-binding protein DksA [Solimonas sp. K1W22B-7]